MNFLKKLKAIFTKDPAERAEIEKELPPTTGHECFWCNEDILEGQPKKTFNSKKFHVACCRQMIKQAKRDIGTGL